MYSVFSEGYVVVELTNRHDRGVYVSMHGDIDLAAEPRLTAAIDQLRVTFAYSTLINFLVRTRAAVPADATVAVSRRRQPCNVCWP